MELRLTKKERKNACTELHGFRIYDRINDNIIITDGTFIFLSNYFSLVWTEEMRNLQINTNFNTVLYNYAL